MTYALTRLASDYARDKQETLKGLRRSIQDSHNPRTLQQFRLTREREAADDYSVVAPRANADRSEEST